MPPLTAGSPTNSSWVIQRARGQEGKSVVLMAVAPASKPDAEPASFTVVAAFAISDPIWPEGLQQVGMKRPRRDFFKPLRAPWSERPLYRGHGRRRDQRRARSYCRGHRHCHRGSDVAFSSASFILVSSDLHSFLTLTDLSRTVFARVEYIFFWASVYNLIALSIAASVVYQAGDQIHTWRHCVAAPFRRVFSPFRFQSSSSIDGDLDPWSRFLAGCCASSSAESIVNCGVFDQCVRFERAQSHSTDAGYCCTCRYPPPGHMRDRQAKKKLSMTASA
ncbi:hypothetical protein K466DRAFT_638237 [Polyporus arcularius HHB13444]|uniref:Uncharacterized protein n=1 Tax=Polyporus arcularius HHB13444 TaxID=1314778 RepID=A0A5C3NU84_9APHY|nr:hypothetical protein K466DRAFT_638237 [Polyporus arcularius HHB13444]